MKARALLEIVPAFEDLARPRSEHGLAPPVVLDAPRAFVSDDGCAEVWPWELGTGRCSALERVVDGDVDRLERKVCAVEVRHHGTLLCSKDGNLVVEFARVHQRSAGCRVGLPRNPPRRWISGSRPFRSGRGRSSPCE